jgi:parvulin-like peptidyl-prolyl isomerase
MSSGHHAIRILAVAAWVSVGVAGCSGSRNETTLTRADRAQRPATGDAPVESAADPADPATDTSAVTVMFINGEAVTAEDVLRPVLPLLKERANTMPLPSYERFLLQTAGLRIRAEARERLLYQEASKGITEQEWEHIDKFVDGRIRDIVNKDYQGRQTRYEKALAEQGLTMDDGRNAIKRAALIQRYLYENVQPRITTPTRRQLWKHFEEKREEMVEPPQREMYLIEITRSGNLNLVPEGGGDAVPVDAAAAIAMARAELDRGTAFSDVARKYSTGINAAEGGYWGYIHRNSVRERLQPAVEALFALEPGQYSEIIETPTAFFLVKCGVIDEGAEPDFEAMQPELVLSYRDQQFESLVDELVKKLQDKATIQPHNLTRFLRGVVEAAPRPDTQPAERGAR